MKQSVPPGLDSYLMEKLRERKMVPALLDESGIKIWQWRKIQQCLKVFMDIKQVGVTEIRMRVLGIDHGEIMHGTNYYTDPTNPSKVKEEVRYWTKDPSYEFIQMLQTTINDYNLNPSDVDYIHIVHGGDHGKNKFHFVSKLILSMKNGKLYSQVFGLADVACRKDHAIILENTCMPLIMKGIDTIETSDIVFLYASNADDGELVIDLDQSNRHACSFSIKPLSFLAGNLAFLAVTMGKENISSSWCNWCRLSKAKWQNTCHVSTDMLWDIYRVNIQADSNIQNGFTDAHMMGVRLSPMSTIPFCRIIFSVQAERGFARSMMVGTIQIISIGNEYWGPLNQKRGERSAGYGFTIDRETNPPQATELIIIHSNDILCSTDISRQ